jgi:hypothetical protein
VLDQRGVLNTLKVGAVRSLLREQLRAAPHAPTSVRGPQAELRANVFLAIHEHDGKQGGAGG